MWTDAIINSTICSWTSLLNSMPSVFYFIPTYSDLEHGSFSKIQSNCFSWKCKLREGQRNREVAIAPTSPFKLWKFGKRLLKTESNLVKIIFACISLRMLVNTVIYIYISWEYNIVERDEFEASFSKNHAGGWSNGSGNLICFPYVDIISLSLSLSLLSLYGKSQETCSLDLWFEVEDRSMTDNTITNYKPLRHVSGWNWPISNTIVAGLDLSAERAVNSAVIFALYRPCTFRFSNQIVAREGSSAKKNLYAPPVFPLRSALLPFHCQRPEIKFTLSLFSPSPPFFLFSSRS